LGFFVTIASLARFNRGHREDDAGWIREQLTRANEVLHAAGLPSHHEPEHVDAVEWIADLRPNNLPYSFVYYLCRAAAKRRLHQDWTAPGEADAADPRDDLDLKRLIGSPDFQLCMNVNAEGLYVPVQFDKVLRDDGDNGLATEALGSSYQLRAELQEVAPALGIQLAADGELSPAEASRIADVADRETSPTRRELLSWLSLYKGAQLSIKRTALWSSLE
jgi:hypothetical protein